MDTEGQAHKRLSTNVSCLPHKHCLVCSADGGPTLLSQQYTATDPLNQFRWQEPDIPDLGKGLLLYTEQPIFLQKHERQRIERKINTER